MILTEKLKSWFDWRHDQFDCERAMLAYAQNGNHKILDSLVNRLGDDLYFYLLSQSDNALAADISQQVWLKVIEKRQLYRVNKSVKAWLFSIGRNLLIDQLRMQNRWQFDELEIQTETEKLPFVASPEIELSQAQLLTQFECLLAALPFAQKEAWILQQEGFSISQISEITQQEPETVKSRLRYARAHLTMPTES
ncbi:sigma-70 family RNA polymerase sigma factor [Algibacillus agarilyticus]|uniref:sigma-70 family RNA polymerase sigma factor n=1 Tax=Algibacillus agarilyticus TaxID=2234133 RepID=UPI001E64BF40|nr:sigma-70 family RNA polymerase sigma factor [Algibacillus agarilyticus]